MYGPTSRREEYRLESGELIYIELESANAEGEGGQVLISHCLDISANGFQVVADEPLVPGSIHRVCIQLLSPHCVLQMVAEVMWSRPCREDSGDYSIGLKLYESQDTDIIQWKQVIATRCSD